MKVRRNSLHRSRNSAIWKKRANQRAAKERKRIERANAKPDWGDMALVAPPIALGLRFRITVECLTDGEKSSFTVAETPHGLTVSPTLCGQRIACVLRHYRPARKKPVIPLLGLRAKAPQFPRRGIS